MRWVTIILGAGLFLSPFLSGFSGQPGLFWYFFILIMGAAIIILGWHKRYGWAANVGLLVCLAPGIFAFGGTTAATCCFIIGGLTALLDGCKSLLFSRNEQTGNKMQQQYQDHA
jgi:hypothetical protein